MDEQIECNGYCTFEDILDGHHRHICCAVLDGIDHSGMGGTHNDGVSGLCIGESSDFAVRSSRSKKTDTHRCVTPLYGSSGAFLRYYFGELANESTA